MITRSQVIQFNEVSAFDKCVVLFLKRVWKTFLSISQLSIHNTIISQPPKLLLEVLLKGVKSIKD